MFINVKTIYNWGSTLCLALALLLSASPVTAVELDPINPTREDCSNIITEGQMLGHSKYEEWNNCTVSNKPNIDDTTNCQGESEKMAWPMCEPLSCEAHEINETYSQKYDQCMDKVKVAEAEKRRQEDVSKAEKRRQEAEERKENKTKAAWLKQFNKATAAAELINNPRKFLTKALHNNQKDFYKIFPTDDDKDANLDLGREVYDFAFNSAKYGLKYATQNKGIKAIQQSSLNKIDQHFRQTFKELDKALASMDRLNNPPQQSTVQNSSETSDKSSYDKQTDKVELLWDESTNQVKNASSHPDGWCYSGSIWYPPGTKTNADFECVGGKWSSP
jgi:hypothetical protein